MKQTDKKLITLAIQKHATSVYQCADLIIEQHGIYRFNFSPQQVMSLIYDMIKATTGNDTNDLALQFGAGYVLMRAEEKPKIEKEELIAST